MPTASKTKPLTARMRDLVNAVDTLTKARGIPPSLTEVAAKLGVHPSRAGQLAAAAEARGGLARDPRIPRSMRVPNPSRR